MEAKQEPLWALSAGALVERLRAREVTPAEVLDALERRIEEINPAINALPTLCWDRARKAARAVETDPGFSDLLLCGLPVPIKDSLSVAGVRTTIGSAAFAEHVPTASDILVEQLESRGAVVYAKSNTPELEAGANTFNEVFGTTVNPWNTALSTGGSSGGAAAAVATGMAWLAQGTDFACSLRNPASLCGVVGLRPTPGLVPQGPSSTPYQTLSVAGPIARTVGDAALALDAMAGFHPLDPLTAPPCNGNGFLRAALSPERAPRAAFSLDLGITPVDADVTRVVKDGIGRLAAHGIEIEETHPDLSAVHEIFRVLRAFQFAMRWRDVLSEHRQLLKPEVVWNIEEGLALDAATIARAENGRAELRRRVLGFLDRHGFLLTPTSIVPAYPVEQRYVSECNGRRFDNYLEWMAIAYAATMVSCPAISIPCGTTRGGLPVGLQIMGPPRAEDRLIRFAAWVEHILDASLTIPIDPDPWKAE